MPKTYEELLGIKKPTGETQTGMPRELTRAVEKREYRAESDSKPVGIHDGTLDVSDERGVELPTIESLDDTPLDALNFNSDDIRYFYSRITGKTWRKDDVTCYNKLLFYLHANKDQFIKEWKIRKKKWEARFKKRELRD